MARRRRRTSNFERLFGATIAALVVAVGCSRASEGDPGAAVPSASSNATSVAAQRIVTTSGALTEIVYALGAEGSLVAADASSVHPAAAERLPRVGDHRQLAVEGVLSHRPTLVISTDDAGPPNVLDQLRAAGVRVELTTTRHDAEGARERIRRVGALLGKEDEAKARIAELDEQLRGAEARLSKLAARPRVLFLYARGAGSLSVAGSNTAAQAMIELARGVNAVVGFEGFRPLTAESAAAAAPEIILVPARGLASLGGVDGVVALPALAATPAGKSRRVVAMDDLLLLGFGPRTGRAVAELGAHLHPELRDAGAGE
jgi:iron complex transport system substrate-binding protein